MSAGALLANLAWYARNRRQARRFVRAIADPRGTQDAWLATQLHHHATSQFGRAHGFDGIRDAATFARRVPLASPADVAPWIERVRRGERDVLAVGTVTHLAPTSGTSGARKLVPFTASLQAGFDAAVSAWMADLVEQRPTVCLGPAYWSISPLEDVERCTAGEVRIGFADDAEYLGGAGAWLVRRLMAAPSSLRHVRDVATFWRLTLVSLLGRRDLRLMSVWHPSFLDLLVEAAAQDWRAVLDGLPTRRAAELDAIGPDDWPRWWPELQVVSCWGDQAAAPGYRRLAARLPHVLVQPKGLLATEAVVTIPYAGRYPLAITSHYFEFIDDTGEARPAHALARGGRYEVVVTNGGGLWRYRLGDIVECTGLLASTPELRFCGRVGHQSDLRGEKLAEPFVAEVLGALWTPAAVPEYLALRAADGAEGAGYELLVAATALREAPADLARRVDAALSANPHYALSRRLGQLAEVRVVAVDRAHAAAELATGRGRLGDRKPALLIRAEASR
jgi:hypothetical protein